MWQHGWRVPRLYIYNKETNLRDDKHTTKHQTKKNFFPSAHSIAFAVVASWLYGHTSSFSSLTSQPCGYLRRVSRYRGLCVGLLLFLRGTNGFPLACALWRRQVPRGLRGAWHRHLALSGYDQLGPASLQCDGRRLSYPLHHHQVHRGILAH